MPRGAKATMPSGAQATTKGGASAETTPYICPCIFWRDKNADDMTCLIKDEINALKRIVQPSASQSGEEWYKSLITSLKCEGDNVDECVMNKLKSKYGDRIMEIYENAIPTIQTKMREQWLSSVEIDKLMYGLEKAKPWFKYMGFATWSGFEDNSGALNVDFITRSIQEEEATVFGIVLNQCHKYSSGKHWCAMVFVRQGIKGGSSFSPVSSNSSSVVSSAKASSVVCYYYDSQGKEGPAKEKISCDNNLPSASPEYEKYQHYKNHFQEWWLRLQSAMKDRGINFINKCSPFFNNFYTQSDEYSCGYHAMMFIFLVVDCAEDGKPFSADKLATKIKGVLNDNENLNDFIQLFQERCVQVGDE